MVGQVCILGSRGPIGIPRVLSMVDKMWRMSNSVRVILQVENGGDGVDEGGDGSDDGMGVMMLELVSVDCVVLPV